ncbi:MAG: 2-amino-4-hydroxy-6-hydroxymethyldihydropteridine diphosphokinase [Gammaproteobacteria bacterium]
MVRAYVSVGSNVDREHHVAASVAELRALARDVEASPVYESAAVGMTGGDFLNLVVAMSVDLDPDGLVAELRRIEAAHGRVRGPERFVDRTLDLDLLLYGDLVRHHGGVDVPHPDILRYAFVLRPLADIAGTQVHPETGETFAALWARFDRRSQPLQPASMHLAERHE